MRPQDSSTRRAIEHLESCIVGRMVLEYLRSSDDGLSFAKTLAYLYDQDLSVVFDEHDHTIIWIGPTSVLPLNAQNHAPVKA